VMYYIDNNTLGIKGSFEELSDTPKILESFVENNHSVEYDSEAQILSINYLPTDKFVILNSLLKNKIVEVVPFSDDEITEIGEGWQPEM